MQTLIQTPLYPLHQEYQAKMLAFAGYNMPLHYSGGIIREHLHTRHHAGLFDISHMGQIQIEGQQAAEMLERLTTSNISGMAIGQQRYTVLTNAQGGVIDDLVITRQDTQSFLLVVNAARKRQDQQHLQQHLPGRCRLMPLEDQALLALQGPAAAQVLAQFSKAAITLKFMHAGTDIINNIPCYISRSGYCGEDGFEISVAAAQVEALARLLLAEPGVSLIGLGARDTLRLEAGLCLYGHELSETISPLAAGLSWIFRKAAGNFPGAEILQQQRRHGTPLTRVGILPAGRIPVRADAELFSAENKPAGYVSSGGFSPCKNAPIAMAYVETSLAAAGQQLFARVRSRNIPVTITTLPFIPHRYYRAS